MLDSLVTHGENEGRTGYRKREQLKKRTILQANDEVKQCSWPNYFLQSFLCDRQNKNMFSR